VNCLSQEMENALTLATESPRARLVRPELRGALADYPVNERSLWITSRRAPLRVAQASELRAIARPWNTTELLTC
jgi:hypothetical protein